VPRASPFFRPALIFTGLLLASSFALRVPPLAAESARSIPPPVLDEPASQQATSEVAVLAGGCFWGGQGLFQHVEGVTSAVSGYAGGGADTAHYEMVGTNTTGHAESVRVTLAEAYIAQLNQAHVFDAPVVTKIEAGRDFYPAEDYH
jgi:peptide-methionine (S)-S-oxide reductase